MKHFHSLYGIPLLLLLLGGCAAMPPQSGSGQDRALREALTSRLDAIQDDLTILSARLQDQEQKLEDLRAAVVAQKVTPRGENAVIAPAPAEKRGEAPGTVPAGASPTEVYLKAFSDYASGRYSEAIAGFQSFLQLFPENDYSGNAQYWLGECYYAQQRYREAAEAFREVAEVYPQGSKTPEALYKMAASLHQLNQPERAQEVLQLLKDRYPSSSAAQKNLPAE